MQVLGYCKYNYKNIKLKKGKLNRNILFITPSFKSGGGIRVILQIANQMVNNRCRVHVIYPNNSDEVNSYKIGEGVKIKKVGKYRPSIISKLCNLLMVCQYVVRHYDPDKWVIVYSDPFTPILAPLFKKYDQWRFFQGDDYNMFNDLHLLKKQWILYFYKIFAKAAYNYSFVNFIFNSSSTYKQFVNISTRFDVKQSIVYPGIDHSVFKPLGIRDNKSFRIMTIGRKHGIKGFQYFIETVNRLKTQITIDEVIVVSQDDLSQFDTLGMSVVVPDNDTEINECYNRANIYVSTSEAEGFGLPALEAMSTGCCVVTTRTEGALAYGKDGENCLMVEPRDSDGMVKAIISLYHDRELMKRIGNAGLISSSEFSVKKCGEQFLNILKLED